MKKNLFIFLFSTVSFGFAQTNSLENVVISILTVGTADESHSLYGHTAVRVQNPADGTDLVYNYGMFDFRTPNFIVQFVKGDMQYFAAAYPYTDFEYNYRLENRSIFEQVLNLTATKKREVIDALQNSITGSEKYYTYKFIQRNCTTKVVTLLNSVLQSETVYKQDRNEASYREVLYPYADNHFFQKLGINLIFGAKTDKEANTLFLPFDLKNSLNQTQYNNQPIVSDQKNIFEANRVAQNIWWDSIFTLVFLLSSILVVNKKFVTNAYFMCLGILGLFFTFVGFYSFHEEIALNYNALLINPVLLLIPFFDWKNNHKASLYSTYVALFCLLVYLVFMLNKIHLAIVWPFIVCNAFLLFKRIYDAKKLTVVSKYD